MQISELNHARARCAAILVAAATALAPAQTTLTQCNTFPLGATTVDQHGQTFTVAGLSGIAYLGEYPIGTDHFVAVMDNSNKLVYIDVVTNWSGCVESAWYAGGLTLSESRDFEGIAMLGGRLFLAEEGTPAVHEFDAATGQRLGTLATPSVFGSRRANFGFESLSAGYAESLWTANEEALTVDGPVSTSSAGTVVRLLRYEPSGAGFVPAEQYAYRCDPLHGSAISGARSGLSDLVEFGIGGSLIGLERSFAFSLNGFFRNRIYEMSFGSATNVASMPALFQQTDTPVQKSLLWSGFLNGNMEGIAAGRWLGWGHVSLVGIFDDGDPISVNMLAGFSLGVGGCPADYNSDGGVDGGDVSSFFEAWEAGDPNADVNWDGGLDGGDVEWFFIIWENGSCS